MKFCFLGGGISKERSCFYQQQIEVHQQHCGGNTLCLFKGYLKPKGNDDNMKGSEAKWANTK